MRKFALGMMALAALMTLPCAYAQQPSHPKVLQVAREVVKPYRNVGLHDKTESAFVGAMSAAHWPTHYLAVDSLSGRGRSLYFTLYDTFAAWEQDTAAMMKNPTLSAALEKAVRADGELLEETSQTVYTYDEDLSYRSSDDIGHMRYVEATVFHVRPGHVKDFMELGKMAIEANRKSGSSAHWSMWDLAYGGDADTYLLLSGDKDMAEIDRSYAENEAFEKALGEDGMKKFRELYAAAIASAESELFAINPRQSYAKDEWVQADPAFWKPKPAAKPAPASATKKPTP